MSDIYPLLAEPQFDTHKGFILSEEMALKEHLTGLSVPHASGDPAGKPEKVGVWFRFPEGERQLRYPFITIDLLMVEPAFDLFHSDHYEPRVTRSGEELYRPDFSPTIPPPPFGNQDWAVKNYLPFRLTFQVSTFARSNLHDRFLTSIFMTDIFPVRPFHIANNVDGTWRRTENLGMVSNNTPETTESGTKRIFRKAWTISMQASIPQNRFTEDELLYKVMRVYIPVVYHDQFDSYFERFLLNQPEPLTDFTREEREEGGELFYVLHEESTP